MWSPSAQVTKTQSSGEGCKILFSESIRERAVFNGVRGSRRHRASGALDPVKLSSPLLHGVGPSARSACAAARSQQHRRRAQPVDSTPAQDCEARRLCHACPAAASLMYLGSSSSQRLARGVLRRRKGARAAANSVRGSGALMSMLCTGALRMICGQPVGRLCARLVT